MIGFLEYVAGCFKGVWRLIYGRFRVDLLWLLLRNLIFQLPL